MTPNGPAYVATPVMTAMVESPADLPSAAANAAVSPAAAQVRGDAATAPSAATTAPARTSESRPAALARADRQIGRAAVRERVGQYVLDSVCSGVFNKKIQ